MIHLREKEFSIDTKRSPDKAVMKESNSVKKGQVEAKSNLKIYLILSKVIPSSLIENVFKINKYYCE
jgi:hypothetical protein